jgi:hypothetical protein
MYDSAWCGAGLEPMLRTVTAAANAASVAGSELIP